MKITLSGGNLQNPPEINRKKCEIWGDYDAIRSKQTHLHDLLQPLDGRRGAEQVHKQARVDDVQPCSLSASQIELAQGGQQAHLTLELLLPRSADSSGFSLKERDQALSVRTQRGRDRVRGAGCGPRDGLCLVCRFLLRSTRGNINPLGFKVFFLQQVEQFDRCSTLATQKRLLSSSEAVV